MCNATLGNKKFSCHDKTDAEVDIAAVAVVNVDSGIAAVVIGDCNSLQVVIAMCPRLLFQHCLAMIPLVGQHPEAKTKLAFLACLSVPLFLCKAQSSTLESTSMPEVKFTQLATYPHPKMRGNVWC